jgi:hypothetical protein
MSVEIPNRQSIIFDGRRRSVENVVLEPSWYLDNELSDEWLAGAMHWRSTDDKESPVETNDETDKT